MVIKKKEVKKEPSITEIDDVINKGGSTTVESKLQEKMSNSEVRFTLRIPANLIRKIDEDRKTRIGSVSRNQWILEAISKAVK